MKVKREERATDQDHEKVRHNKTTAGLSVGEEGGGGCGERLQGQEQEERELSVVAIVLGGLHGLGLNGA